ncbi:MAG TPA: excisionase family DNA-binding protein [Bacteroidales bacterium]|jgi:excisionase family DNA binding protein|nr:excisionase family DNA-binding protein [Bacteroidales bacterium]
MKIITKSEVCQVMGKTHNQITQLINKKEIPFHKVGWNKYLFFEEDIKYYLKTGLIRNSGLKHSSNDEILIQIADSIRRSAYLYYINQISNKKTFMIMVGEIALTFLLRKNLKLVKKNRKYILSGNLSNGEILTPENIKMFLFRIIKNLNLYNENRKTYYATVNEVYRQFVCMIPSA